VEGNQVYCGGTGAKNVQREGKTGVDVNRVRTWQGAVWKKQEPRGN